MKNIKDMTQAELAAFVYSKLVNQNIDVILSGGTAAAIYSQGIYTSFDIDFIPYRPITNKSLAPIMGKLDFRLDGRYFKHPDTSFFIEFPPGPPSIGSEIIDSFNILTLETGKLKLLTPTDSAKDRLSAYYHWHDEQSLEIALAIAHSHKLDLNDIKQWSIKEYKLIEFNIFLQRIKS